MSSLPGTPSRRWRRLAAAPARRSRVRVAARLSPLVVFALLAAALAGCLGSDGSSDGVPHEHRGDVIVSTEPLIPLTHNVSADAGAILAACRGTDDPSGCATEHLLPILANTSAIYAFDLLEEMAKRDDTIDRRSHPIAHDLGRHALHVHHTIEATLANCSYKVFQGCLHGALQEHFQYLGALTPDDVEVCPAGGNDFERYACVHGLGHGLVLATGYDIPRSLELCDGLKATRDSNNCYGGVYMENVVAYMDHERGGGGHDHGHAHHAHGGDAPPEFWIDPDDPHYPCNAVATKYQSHCWLMQTSLVLFLNKGDFQATAIVCSELDGSAKESCFRSLGRDAGSYTGRDPVAVSERCAYAAEPDMRAVCIQGYVAALILNYVDPATALPRCEAIGETDKAACYYGMGRSGRNMVTSDELAALCTQAEEGYEDDCREGGRL